MKRWKKITLSILAGILVIALGFTAVQRIAYNRSAMAGMCEIVLSLLADDSSFEETTEMLRTQKESGQEETVDINDFKTTSTVDTEKINGRDVWYLNKEVDSNITIIYLHGGGYVYEINSSQWETADKIARKANAKLIIPDYGLAPFYDYKDAYDLITKIYTEYKEAHPDEKVFLMGDSAGGGLSLGLAEYFVQNNISSPDGLILLSPWVDVTMSNEDAKDYADKDPMLNADMLIACGNSWAGEIDPASWQTSPIFGQMEGLPDTLLFSGTREIFYPDEVLLAEKLDDAGVNVTFEIGHGLNHVYPGYPIPEGKIAINQIVEFVSK